MKREQIDLIEILGTITTRDEAGRHFTERYPSAVLERLESAGLIEIHRPAHLCGISYSQDCWWVAVTDAGVEWVDKA